MRNLPRRLRAPVIVQALAVADTAEADAIISIIPDLISEQDADSLLRAAARAWTRLSDDARRTWIAIASDSATAHIQALARSEAAPDRLAAAAIAADLLTARLGIRTAHAETTLIDALRTSLKSATTWQRPILDAVAQVAHKNTAGRDGLDDTLADIVARYEEHRHAGIIAAVLARAEHAESKLRDWLARADEPGHMAIRAAARRLEPSMSPRRAVSLLSVPALSPIALDRLANLEDPAHLSELLQLSHIARLPAVRARLQRIPRLLALLPDDSTLNAMPASHRRAFLRWLEILPVNDAHRLARTTPRLTDPDPLVRAGAVRILAKLPASPQLDDALFEFALDPHPDIARAACDALASTPSENRRSALADRFAILLRSPHPHVRALSTHALRSVGIADPRSPRNTWQDPVPFLRALRSDRAQAIADLEQQLRSTDRTLALAALTLADRAQLCTDLHNAIIHATRSPDAHIAAKAVRTLARLDSEQSAQALRAAAEHPDPRVRAEAVEVNARAIRASSHLDTIDLQHRLNDSTPRIRANAIHAMLHSARNQTDAHAALAEMLGAQDPSIRAAALWLAEKHATPDLADRLAHLVRTETDPRLRERAKRSARILLARMRRQWHDAPNRPESMTATVNPAQAVTAAVA